MNHIVMGVIVIGLGTTTVSGCSPPAKTAVEAADESAASAPTEEIETGTAVCFGSVLPMRYVLEDALEARELEPVDSCTVADIRVEENGAPGAYVLRYQRIGDDDWKSCESDSQDRVVFLQACTEHMIEGASGGAPTAGAEETP